MKSEINLNLAKAFEASANAKLSKEQIKTVNAQIEHWADQADFWGASIELKTFSREYPKKKKLTMCKKHKKGCSKA